MRHITDNRKMTKVEIDNLITKYFDGETTITEEKELWRQLSTTVNSGKDRDATLAVMSFLKKSYPSEQKRATSNSRRNIKSVIKYAAMVVIGLGVALSAGEIIRSSRQQECFAYINGKRVDNDEEVINRMLDEMRQMEIVTSPKCDNVVVEQLNSIGAIIE